MRGILRNTFVRMAIVVMVMFFLITFVTLRLQNNELNTKAEMLSQRIDDVNKEIDQLYVDLTRPLDNEYIAQLAREKLGLRFPNEIIFYGGTKE